MSLLHLCPTGPLTSFGTTYWSSCTFVQALLGFQDVSCKPTSDDRSTVLNPFDIDVQYWKEQVSRNDAENYERCWPKDLCTRFSCAHLHDGSKCSLRTVHLLKQHCSRSLPLQFLSIFVHHVPQIIFSIPRHPASYQACALKSSLSQNDRGFVNVNPLQGITNFFNEFRK